MTACHGRGRQAGRERNSSSSDSARGGPSSALRTPRRCAAPSTATTLGPGARRTASARSWSRSSMSTVRMPRGMPLSSSGSTSAIWSAAQASLSRSSGPKASRAQNLRSMSHMTPLAASRADSSAARETRARASCSCCASTPSPGALLGAPSAAGAVRGARAFRALSRAWLRAMASLASWSNWAGVVMTSSQKGVRAFMRARVTLARRSPRMTRAPVSSAAAAAAANSRPGWRSMSTSAERYSMDIISVQSAATRAMASDVSRAPPCSSGGAACVSRSICLRSSQSSSTTAEGRSLRMRAAV
mmetsp:Transcript_19798/g.66575  ORF Transcript_19798/g.66575 Transcript_19798/m.66575 type:complete len:302 (+) Transcript_19798:406-1311(+)